MPAFFGPCSPEAFAMIEKITAIYEHGVLRLLTPLSLPERTQVELQIVGHRPPTLADEQQQVQQALITAGLVLPQPPSMPGDEISEAELMAVAQRLSTAGPLSDLILAEREDR